jgi:hypothetical protein
MIANSRPASPALWILPLVSTTLIPNSVAGTAASAGYTCEHVPSRFDLNRS